MLGTRIILCMLVLTVTAADLDHDFLHESPFAADYTVANAVQHLETQPEAQNAAGFIDYSDAAIDMVGLPEITAEEGDFLDMVGLPEMPETDVVPTDAAIAAEIEFLQTAIFRENPVLLGRAGDFAILSQSGISSVPHSLVVGNIGVSPIGGTGITGFSLTVHPSILILPDSPFLSSTQVVGRVYALDYQESHEYLTRAVADMHKAYEDAASRIDSGPSFVNAFQGIIAGKVLPCGVYEWDRDITFTGNVYLEGLEEDVMILKTTGNLIVGAGAEVFLSGGLRACNVVWQVAGFVELGPDAYLHGIFLVKGKAVLQTRAGINGRLLVQTAVTLDQSSISSPQVIYP
jgi:hypothetical protein